MRRFSIFAVCLFALALSTAAFAQNPQDPQGRRAQRKGRDHGGKLKKMDANQDGQITREEWKGRPEGFSKIDRNNDGTINREEAMVTGKARGKRHLRKMDANQDGQIAREEWKGNAETFGKLDVNNDGVISKQELKSRQHNRQRPPQ